MITGSVERLEQALGGRKVAYMTESVIAPFSMKSLCESKYNDILLSISNDQNILTLYDVLLFIVGDSCDCPIVERTDRDEWHVYFCHYVRNEHVYDPLPAYAEDTDKDLLTALLWATQCYLENY